MAQSTSPIADNLWNNEITPDSYGSKEQYFEHLFEQYKLMVEAVDRISNRRNQANTFFLTLHTFLIVGLQFLYEKGPTLVENITLVLPLVALLTLCYVWKRLIGSYRQLNSGKFKVIAEYEKKLPSSPYVKAEWTALGAGKDPNLYTPLTKLEKWVPLVFALIYILGTIIVIVL